MAKTTRAKALPLEIAQDCVAVKLRAISRSVSSIYDEALRPLGLKVSQLNVLVAIATTEGVRPGQVARALHMDKSTLSRNLDKMQRRGWVNIRRGEGRSQQLSLTPEGQALLSQAEPLWRAAQARASERLGEDGVAALRSMHRALSN